MKDFVEIKGSRMYYEITGEGEAIVFIHADGLDCSMWDAQYEYFKNKYTIIRYDIRGFGKSDVPSEQPYSFAEDLNILLQHLSIEKAHLVGLSLGGAIAIDFALLCPDKTLSLIVADSGIAGSGFSEKFLREVDTIIALAKENKLAEAKAKWLNLDFFEYSRKLPKVWSRIETMVADTSGYRWFGNNQPIDLQPLASERLQDVHVPTLIVIGEYDIADFQKKVPFMHEKIKNSRVIQIPNAGHLSNMDNPDRFNKELEVFLERLH